jgi:hypothetical protein
VPDDVEVHIDIDGEICRVATLYPQQQLWGSELGSVKGDQSGCEMLYDFRTSIPTDDTDFFTLSNYSMGMDAEAIRIQHDSIAEHAAALAAAISQPTYTPVATIRWKLARELIGHLAVEDRLLYPALIGSVDQRTSTVARRFKEEMGGLSSTFTSYMREWTDQRITAEWSAFCSETRALLAALSNRIARENNELYPLANQAIKSDRTMVATVKSLPQAG